MSIKKILLATTAALCFATAASAADLGARPIYKAPPPAAPLWSWTGFYIGAHIGGAWSSSDVTDVFGGAGTIDSSAFIGGGQIGYNWQFAPNWVLGVEGEFSGFAGGDESIATTPLVASTYDPSWIGSVSGRLGYTGGNWLIYAKGGAAWLNADYTVSTPLGAVTSSDTSSGYLVGGGIEWLLWSNWTAKVEYNFLSFDTRAVGSPVIGAASSFDTDINVVKVGLNYKF